MRKVLLSMFSHLMSFWGNNAVDQTNLSAVLENLFTAIIWNCIAFSRIFYYHSTFSNLPSSKWNLLHFTHHSYISSVIARHSPFIPFAVISTQQPIWAMCFGIDCSTLWISVHSRNRDRSFLTQFYGICYVIRSWTG